MVGQSVITDHIHGAYQRYLKHCIVQDAVHGAERVVVVTALGTECAIMDVLIP